MTKAAWSAKEEEITKAKQGTTRDKFIYNLSRASYEKEWGDEYERPGIFARFLAFIFQLIPKVGPLKAFAFHVPTPEAEKLFMESFNQTLDRYRVRLDTLHRDGQLLLPNENLDTGKTTSSAPTNWPTRLTRNCWRNWLTKNTTGWTQSSGLRSLNTSREPKPLDERLQNNCETRTRGPAPCTSLENRVCPVLEHCLDLLHELIGQRAVDQAMIEGQCQVSTPSESRWHRRQRPEPSRSRRRRGSRLAAD